MSSLSSDGLMTLHIQGPPKDIFRNRTHWIESLSIDKPVQRPDSELLLVSSPFSRWLSTSAWSPSIHGHAVQPLCQAGHRVSAWYAVPRSPSCLARLCCWYPAWSVFAAPGLIELANPTEPDHLSPTLLCQQPSPREVQGVLVWGAQTCQGTWWRAVCRRSLCPEMKIHP